MMRIKLYALFGLIIILNTAQGQDPGILRGEFMIVNRTSRSVMIKMYPIGAIFNGNKEYNFKAKNPILNHSPFIFGIQDTLDALYPDNRCLVRANFDDSTSGGPLDGTKFSVGYGLYKIEFYYHFNPEWELVDTCYMDWRDAGLRNTPGHYPPGLGSNDLRIDIFDMTGTFGDDSIAFKHYQPGGTFVNIRATDRHIKYWEFKGTDFENTTIVPLKGPFKSVNESSYSTNYPINAVDSGAVNHINPGIFELDLKIITQNINIKPNQNLFFKNSSLTIDNNINFSIDAGESISFTGSGSGLICNPASSIIFPENYQLAISNGARLIAKGSTFTSNSTWNGIKLENSGIDSIIGCTFNNASTAITVYNTESPYGYNKVIKKDTFNVSKTNGKGLNINNQFFALIDSNVFNLTGSGSPVGIFFRNSVNNGPPSSASSPPTYYSINITNNKFLYGFVPVFLSCTASDRTPFYVFGNEFTGTNTYSIAGMKITGNIKYNRFDDDNSNRCLGLWNSNPNLYGNIFSSEGINIYLNSSYPKLSPLKNTVNQLEWEGGRNSFYSGGSDNIKFANASFPNLKKGRNSFTVDNSQAYHIYGHLPDSINLYDITYNCWLGHNDTAKYDFYKTVNDTIYQTVAALSIPKFCIPATVTGQKVSDIGNGIYDTILVTNDTSATSMTSEEILLAQANSSFDNQNYPDAITNYKGFIDNYPTSQFVYDAGYYLFDCYNMLDTSYNENTTDVLFGDLKQFLNDKITSGNYDMDFKDIALFLILMCETSVFSA